MPKPHSSHARGCAWIPTALTLSNLLCGLVATVWIIAVFTGALDATRSPLALASPVVALLIAAGILDTLDGAAARRFGLTSSRGQRLDALADAVSFGVAPAVALAIIGSQTLRGPAAMWLGLGVMFLFGTLARLRRFTQAEPVPWFQGMPSPAAALMLVATLSVASDQASLLEATAMGLSTLVITAAANSRWRYPHPARWNAFPGTKGFTILMITGGVVGLVLAPGWGLIVGLGWGYLLAGPLVARMTEEPTAGSIADDDAEQRPTV